MKLKEVVPPGTRMKPFNLRVLKTEFARSNILVFQTFSCESVGGIAIEALKHDKLT